MTGPKNLAEAVTELYQLLESFNQDERKRIITSTLALFGEDVPVNSDQKKTSPDLDDLGDEFAQSIGKKARHWVKQNHLSEDQIQEVFHVDTDGKFEIIAADVPGGTNKEKTGSAYLLIGAAKLLSEDDASFSNDAAVALCKHIGCYDKNNHSVNRNALGNKLAGSVKSGFTLPAPGLKAAAEVIKKIANGAS